MHLDTLMPGTVVCTLAFISRAKGIPRRVLGTGVRRSNPLEASCNLGIFCVAVLGETGDREQLLANQIWVCLWEQGKAPKLTVGCGERKYRLYYRGQARSPESYA